MDKPEYEILKAKLLTDYGAPEYNNAQPINESARRLQELVKTYRLSRLAASRAEDKLKNAARMAQENLSDEKARDLKYTRIPEISLSDQELGPFTTREVDLLKSHFENLNLSPKQLAVQHGWNTAKVVALFHSAAYKILYQKVFDRILPLESLMAIQKAMKTGDSKVTLEVARHYKLLQNETLDVNETIKPIEDPEMMKKLKELGDSIA